MIEADATAIAPPFTSPTPRAQRVTGLLACILTSDQMKPQTKKTKGKTERGN
jgi:hypothetical protein